MAEMRAQLSFSQHKAAEEPQRVVEWRTEEDLTEKMALKVTCHLICCISIFFFFFFSPVSDCIVKFFNMSLSSTGSVV
jgi:hypothetical protein